MPLAALRGRHETLNRRFKTFGALETTSGLTPVSHIILQVAAVLWCSWHTNVGILHTMLLVMSIRQLEAD
jgi:hypothetical protein